MRRLIFWSASGFRTYISFKIKLKMSKTLSTFSTKVLILVLIYIAFASSLTPTSVSTNVGSIAGSRRSQTINGQDKVITEFFGIPYGEDTSGQNRFKKPIPKASFNSTFNAFTQPPPCMQFANFLSNQTVNMTEDCLMLNIYVPSDLGSTASTGLLPVMIWIHGGAYVSGSAREYPGDVLSHVGDIIIVTINYRLAEYGFLNVGDARASGNQALWDQHLAIRWVNNNIRAFRGNPHQISIFGESAGSVSVTYHSLYAGNKGLFKRVIAQSGSALGYWAFNAKPDPSCLFERAGCDKGPLDPVECLRRMSTSDFYKVLLSLQTPSTFAACRSQLPSIDHDFVVERPSDIALGTNNVSHAARDFFRSLDILTGVNNGEGALYILTVWLQALRQINMNNLTVTVSDFEKIIVPGVMSLAMERPSNESWNTVKKAIVFEYVDWKSPSDNTRLRDRLIKLSSDISFYVATSQLLQAHSTAPQGRTFQYYFTVEPPMRVLPTPLWFRGANHIDEIEYTLGGPFQPLETFYVPTPRNGVITDKDRALSLGMMTAWSNFAKTRLV